MWIDFSKLLQRRYHSRIALVLLFCFMVLLCEVGCRGRIRRIPGGTGTTTPTGQRFLVDQAGPSASLLPNPAPPSPSGPASPPAGPVQDFVTLFNNERIAVGAPGGAISWGFAGTAGTAQEHLNAMLSQNFFGLADPSGITMPMRAAATGLISSRSVQGVAEGFPTAQALFTALRGNPDFELAINVFSSAGMGLQSFMGVAFDPARGGTWAFIIRD